MNEECVIFFVKHPVMEKVKSRLAAVIGEDPAVEAYIRFVLDILGTLGNCGVAVRIYYSPHNAGDPVKAWLGQGYGYFRQNGRDLGERMSNAFIETFKDGFKKAVLLGSDAPDLPSSNIGRAFRSLEKSGAVLGPAADGGYYLIGFRRDRFLPSVFSGINWSTRSVFDETKKKLAWHNAEAKVLPEWTDVDTIEDLSALMKRNRTGWFSGSRTMKYLLEIENRIIQPEV